MTHDQPAYRFLFFRTNSLAALLMCTLCFRRVLEGGTRRNIPVTRRRGTSMDQNPHHTSFHPFIVFHVVKGGKAIHAGALTPCDGDSDTHAGALTPCVGMLPRLPLSRMRLRDSVHLNKSS